MAATSNGPEVATILAEPDDAIALMVLGHGSGTPIYRPLMVQMAEALANHRIATFRYNYPYSEGMTTYSPDLIDPLDVLLATTSAAKSAGSRALSLDLPLFLGGRSMSSQVVSVALTREHWPDVRGVVLYVFPMRWRNLLENPVGHLHRVPVPMLFVQGGRDEEFCDLREFQPVLDGLGGPRDSARHRGRRPLLRSAGRVGQNEVGRAIGGCFRDGRVDTQATEVRTGERPRYNRYGSARSWDGFRARLGDVSSVLTS